MKKYIFIIMGICLFLHLSQTAQATEIDQIAYNLNLNLNNNQPSYQGSVSIKFNATNITNDLHLNFTKGHIKTLTINNQKITPYQYSQNKLLISKAHLKPNTNTIKVTFSKPYNTDNTGLISYKDPADNQNYIYSKAHSDYANNIFPCFNTPNNQTSIKLVIETPENWQVITSDQEEIVSLPNKGKRLWVFKTTKNITTQNFVLAAGPFKMWRDESSKTPTRLFVRQSMVSLVNPKDLLQTTKLGMAFYASYYKTPYPYTKHDQVFVPDISANNTASAATILLNDNVLKQNTAHKQEQVRQLLNKMAALWLVPNTTVASEDNIKLLNTYSNYTANLAEKEVTKASQTDIIKPETSHTPGNMAANFDSIQPEPMMPGAKTTNEFFSYLNKHNNKVASTNKTYCSKENSTQIDTLLTTNPNLPEVVKNHFLGAKNKNEECLKLNN